MIVPLPCYSSDLVVVRNYSWGPDCDCPTSVHWRLQTTLYSYICQCRSLRHDGPHSCPKLWGSSWTNGKAAGKRRPFGPSPVHIATAHSSTVNVSGYKLSGRISGVDLRFCWTRALVTLLWKEAWERILKHSPTKAPDLIPNQSLELVGADGATLKTHGTALLTLQLNGNIPIYVAVVSPLTTEGVLGLNFLNIINLEPEELLLWAKGITLPLWQSTQLSTSKVQIKVKVYTMEYFSSRLQ